MKQRKIVTIGIPCYNEEKNVFYAHAEIQKVIRKLKSYTFQFLYIDNGSLDGTRKKILDLSKKQKNIRGVFLSRNFGFEASIAAIMDHAKGDAVIVIPCDMQDPPELITQFLEKWEQGYSVVAGKYRNTEDDVFTAFLRRSFYFILKKISNLDIPVNASEVSLLDRGAVDAIRKLPEKFRFYRGLRVWIGLKAAFIPYHRRKRIHGDSAYNIGSYFKYAERGLYGFSYLILDIMMYSAMALVLLSVLSMVLYFTYHFVFGVHYNSLHVIVLALFILGSIQLFGMGILGKYIQVIVEETKQRPVYMVEGSTEGKK